MAGLQAKQWDFICLLLPTTNERAVYALQTYV